jgi:enoyl-[acyl-carrier protein] reductase II
MNNFGFFHNLGIKYPLIQGRYGLDIDSSLAGSFNAGGLGLIAAATPLEYIRQEIRKAKQLTDKPFGGNNHALE